MSGTPDDASPGGRRGLTLIEVAIILVILWVTAELVFGALAAARERARRSKCCSILKNAFGYASHLYSGDNNGRFPASVSVLFPNYVPDGECFLCPSAGKATGITHDKFTPGMAFDTYTDYVYVSGLGADDPSGYVFAFDDEWNHDGEGAYVLFVGGMVEWIHDLKWLHERLAWQEKELAAQGREMKLLRPAWSTWPDAPTRPWYSSLGGRAAAAGALAAMAVALALVVRTVTRRRGRTPGRASRSDAGPDEPTEGGEESEERG